MTRKHPIFADFSEREHDFSVKIAMIRPFCVIRGEYEHIWRNKPHEIRSKFTTDSKQSSLRTKAADVHLLDVTCSALEVHRGTPR